MTNKLTVRNTPCDSCPYRRDVPSGIWHESEYAKLRQYDGDVPDQAMAGASKLFFCHQQTGHLCAGWVGCHDMQNNLAVRLSSGRIDLDIIDYVSPVPLFASGAEAAEHGMRDVARPKAAAVRKIARLQRRKKKSS